MVDNWHILMTWPAVLHAARAVYIYLYLNFETPAHICYKYATNPNLNILLE